MASTMRSMAKGLSSQQPESVKEKQENVVEPAQHDPLPELVTVTEAIVADLPPSSEESSAFEPVLNAEILEPVLSETTTSLPEKMGKSKSSSKKSKVTDQKKVKTPLSETDT